MEHSELAHMSSPVPIKLKTISRIAPRKQKSIARRSIGRSRSNYNEAAISGEYVRLYLPIHPHAVKPRHINIVFSPAEDLPNLTHRGRRGSHG